MLIALDIFIFSIFFVVVVLGLAAALVVAKHDSKSVQLRKDYRELQGKYTDSKLECYRALRRLRIHRQSDAHERAKERSKKRNALAKRIDKQKPPKDCT